LARLCRTGDCVWTCGVAQAANPILRCAGTIH
jgi:hypothetical protein